MFALWFVSFLFFEFQSLLVFWTNSTSQVAVLLFIRQPFGCFPMLIIDVCMLIQPWTARVIDGLCSRPGRAYGSGKS